MVERLTAERVMPRCQKILVQIKDTAQRAGSSVIEQQTFSLQIGGLNPSLPTNFLCAYSSVGRAARVEPLQVIGSNPIKRSLAVLVKWNHGEFRELSVAGSEPAHRARSSSNRDALDLRLSTASEKFFLTTLQLQSLCSIYL